MLLYYTTRCASPTDSTGSARTATESRCMYHLASYNNISELGHLFVPDFAFPVAGRAVLKQVPAHIPYSLQRVS